MGRTRVACLLLAAVSTVIALAGGATIGLRSNKQVSLEELVDLPPVTLRERLYSGALDSATGQHMSPQENAVDIASPHARYVRFWDGATEDQKLASNSDALISSQSYYPTQAGEAARRPHIARQFGAQGKVIDERVVRLDGSLAQTTAVDSADGKIIVDYANDGATHLREQVFSPPKCCDGAVLLRDEIWRDDESHTLAHRDVFNDDESRTITDFDEHMRILKVTQWPPQHSTNGVTVKAFYPGSFKLRMESSTDYNKNLIHYYREDGTLEAQVEMSSSMLEVHYFDATGTKERLYQMFFVNGDYKNSTTDDTTYSLYVVTEFDAAGNKTRSFSMNKEGVHDVQYFNVTVDGVEFFELDYNYKDGVLQDKRYWLHEVKFPPYKLEEHAASEHIVAPQLDPSEAKLQVQIDSGLPRPAPQRGGGY